ncbi:MAG TPA: hypothetical protein VIM63_16370 [Rhodoferax sp.]
MFKEDVPDREHKIEHLRQVISDSYERRFLSKGGRTVWTQASETAILDDEHRYTGSLAMFSAIDKRKHAIKTLSSEIKN